jgi:2-keto-4-pentenoate hydratase/2-oxohepta-3-ene-1,7-dioic acid hydratase in catechol pathway
MDKIICLGKNYAEHAKEMGEAKPEKPVIFLKPPSVMKSASEIHEKLSAAFISEFGQVHHECEIVLRLDRGGYRMSLQEAKQAIGSLTVGLDMTLREKQSELKKKGQPWTVSKVFPDSAIVGPFIRVREFPDFCDVEFTLHVDGEKRQVGFGRDMELDPAASVAYISNFFPLVAGDLIFTGTPKGVNSIQSGQKADLVWGKIAYSVTWN